MTTYEIANVNEKKTNSSTHSAWKYQLDSNGSYRNIDDITDDQSKTDAVRAAASGLTSPICVECVRFMASVCSFDGMVSHHPS